RFWSLALKEIRQIRRDRRLTLSLIVPPLLQILLFGFALDPDVQDLRLGVVDLSRTPESRELISAVTENRTFRLSGSYATTTALEQAISRGRLDVGVVIPYDFAKLRWRGRPVTVQVLVNAVNANTAQIAQGYVEGAIAWLAQGGAEARGPSGVARARGTGPTETEGAASRITTPRGQGGQSVSTPNAAQDEIPAMASSRPAAARIE